MNTDDSQRGNTAGPGNRNMGPPKYPEKMENYSPSTAFNYSPGTGFTGGQQHPRHRNDRFKRESPNMSDRIVKQNDIIIRLLKEIRDRLPGPVYQDQKPAAPAESTAPVADASESGADGNAGTEQSAQAPGPGQDSPASS
jgi:hypothetical protein